MCTWCFSVQIAQNESGWWLLFAQRMNSNGGGCIVFRTWFSLAEKGKICDNIEWYQGQKVRSSTQACLQENFWPWAPPKTWVSSHFSKKNERITNVFEDCGSTQCRAIRYQRGQKVRSSTIDNVPMPGLSVSYDAGEPGICIAWRKYLQKPFCT